MIKRDPSTIVRHESPKKAEIRKDYRGTVIIKGKKDHHICYLDQVSRVQLVEIVPVESYKEFNVDMSNPNENCSCRCLII